jgi:PAS domain S-box-containing protein
MVLVPAAALGLGAYASVEGERDAAREARHSLEVVRAAERLDADLADARAGVAAAGGGEDRAALDAVARAHARLADGLATLERRIPDDPEQARRLAGARERLAAWWTGPAAALRRAAADGRRPEGPGHAREATAGLDGLRLEIGRLVETETRRLEARTRAHQAAQRRTRLVLLAGSGVVLAAGVCASLVLGRRVVGPLLALTRQADRLADGGGAGPAAGQSGDEVRRLEAAFSRMVTEVHQRESDLDRSRREAETFVEIQRDLAETLEPTILLQKIARHARLLTRSDLVFIAPFDPHAGVARVVALLGERTAALRHLRIEPGRGLAGWALRERQPFRTENYLDDPRFHGTMDPVLAEGVAAHLAVPMILEQAVIGLIVVGNRSATAFTERDEAVLGRLAVPAALAIRSARLVSELGLERDLLAVRSRERVRSEAQLRGILQAASDGVFTVDPQGHITSVNRAGHVMFGYGPQELLARDLALIVPEPVEPAPDPPDTPAGIGPRATGPRRREIQGVRRDGTRFPIELSVSVVKTEHDHFLAVIVRDITERKQAFETRFQLAAIVDSTDDAIIGWSPDLAIASWNPGAERLYGYAAPEILGQPFTRLAPPDRQAEGSRFVDRLRRGEHLANYETVRRTRDGRLIDVSLTISATRDEGGRVTGYSTIERDITERKAIERLKDEFIATVSHELRTPLTAIRGHLELVLDGEAGPVSALQREFLTIAGQNTDRLGALINDLLDVESFEAGKMQIRQDPLDLADVLREVAATFRREAERRGLAFREAIPDRLVTVGDRDRLIQVFANLVSNAIKYTPRGEVGITAGRAGGPIEVVVHDTGVGIAAEDQPYLFTRFYRSADPAVRDAGGTGLGLVIARAIVERHGGTMNVDSQKGAGSRFRVVLP